MISIRNILTCTLFFIASMTIVSCGVVQNPTEIQPFLYKEIPLKRDVYVCETTGMKGSIVVDPTGTNSLCRCALDNWYYRNNPYRWSEWRGSLSSKDRLIAFLPKGTRYIIQRYHVPDLMNQSIPTAYIIIMSGPYRGMQLIWPRFYINEDMATMAWTKASF